MFIRRFSKAIIFGGCGLVAVGIIIAAIFIIKNVLANRINYDEYRYVEVFDYDGKVSVNRNDKDIKVFANMRLIAKDTCETDDDSTLELLVDDDKHIEAGENTKFKITAKGSPKKGSVSIKLVSGNALFTIDEKLREDDSFEVVTGNATLSVRGTKFLVDYNKKINVTYVEVKNGTVWAQTNDGLYILNEGDSATIYDDYTEATVPASSGVIENGDGGNALSSQAGSGTTSSDNWKDAYEQIAYDPETFLADVDAEFSVRKVTGISFALMKTDGASDQIPELLLFTYGDFGGNGRYNPCYFITYDQASGSARLICKETVGINYLFLTVDDRPAYFYNENNGDWSVNEFDLSSGSMSLGMNLASGSASNFINWRDSLSGSVLVESGYIDAGDISYAISNYN